MTYDHMLALTVGLVIGIWLDKVLRPKPHDKENRE